MICTTWDEYMQSKWEGETIWIVTLTDNTVVYDDTGRVDNAWLNLRAYCLENNLKIAKLSLRFRSHWEHLPVGQSYYFIKSVLGQFGTEHNVHYYNVGVYDGNKLINHKFRVPELLLESTEERKIDNYRNILI